MKTLILYSSLTGCSEDVAKYIKHNLTNCSVENLSQGFPNIDNFDLIVLGTGIYFYKIHKHLKRYLKKFEKDLTNKKFIIYYCCGSNNQKKHKKYVSKNFSKTIQDNAIDIVYVGGKLRPKRARFPKIIFSFFTLSLLKIANKPLPQLNYENLDNLVETIKQHTQDEKQENNNNKSVNEKSNNKTGNKNTSKSNKPNTVKNKKDNQNKQSKSKANKK